MLTAEDLESLGLARENLALHVDAIVVLRSYSVRTTDPTVFIMRTQPSTRDAIHRALTSHGQNRSHRVCAGTSTRARPHLEVDREHPAPKPDVAAVIVVADSSFQDLPQMRFR